MEQRRTIKVGRIVRPHGTKGAVKVDLLTDFPGRFAPGKTLLLRGGPVTIVESQLAPGEARLRLEGVETMEDAVALKWEYLEVPEDDPPEAEEGVYAERDLVGCEAYDLEGRLLGTFEAVRHAPAHDLWQIGGVLVPAVHEFVREVDMAARRIVLAPIPGMFDEEAP